MMISVIIPVYNAEKFLEKSVKSVLQFDEVMEIILCEDCSTDESLTVCQKLALNNSKIKVFQHKDKKNHGAAESRNLGLENATQEYIAFLDADDYYLPNRFDKEKEFLRNPKIDGIFGALGIEYLTKEGKEAFQDKFKNVELTTVNYLAEGREIFKGLLDLTEKKFGTFFHLNTFTLKKSAIEVHKLRFNKNLRVHQDSDFIIKAAYLCNLKTGIIDKAIAIRGVHDDNRITKIQQYSSKYYKNQLLLQESLFQWSRNITIEDSYRNLFKLKFISLKTANMNGLKKYCYFFINCLLNPKLLKTKYRFNAFNSHQNS